MQRIITPETVSLFAHSNAAYVTRPVRGIVVSFHGLGGYHPPYPAEGTERDRLYAAKGVLTIIPEYGPWNWMNDASVQLVDLVIDAYREQLGLDPALPLVSEGGSMGGHAALAYLLFGSQKAAACAVNCPVCDLAYHYAERPDVPRTMFSAYGGTREDLMDVLRRRSPVERAEELPDIPYHIVHTKTDEAVSKAMHTDRLVPQLKRLGRQVEYVELDGLSHCQMTAEAVDAYNRFVLLHAGASPE